MRTLWTAQAERDIDAIWIYVAADDVDAADRLVARFRAVLITLGEQPRIGRRGRARGLYQFAVPGTPYILHYRIRRDAVRVLRIMHGARKRPH